MPPVNRRPPYELYPTAEREVALWQCHKLHCDLYSAARQERIAAYRFAGKAIGFAQQCKTLTEIRQDNPEYRALNASRRRAPRAPRSSPRANRIGNVETLKRGSSAEVFAILLSGPGRGQRFRQRQRSSIRRPGRFSMPCASKRKKPDARCPCWRRGNRPGPPGSQLHPEPAKRP